MRAIECRALVGRQMIVCRQIPMFDEIVEVAQLAVFVDLLRRMQGEMVKAGAPIHTHHWETYGMTWRT